MQNLTYKILEKHLLKGKLEAGQPIEIKMDQTLTQDATGTMAYMQFEAMGVKKVKTELSVSYVDHNTLQNGFMNADDHAHQHLPLWDVSPLVLEDWTSPKLWQELVTV